MNHWWKINQIKKQSLKDAISVVRKKTVQKIIKTIKINKYQNLLEIGSGYGYSMFKFKNYIIEGLTIEKNYEHFFVAKNNLQEFKHITIVNNDAFEYLPKKKYDVIFIDGCKSHQEILVQHYMLFLHKNGTMFVDNIFLHKYQRSKILSPRKLKLLKRVESFANWLKNNQKYQVTILPFDDGLAQIKHFSV